MVRQPLTLLALTGTNTDANGVWYDVSQAEFPLAVTIVGAGAGDGITLNVTNQNPLPANATHDTPVSAAITSDGITYINGPVMGLKARKPAATQSTTVYVLIRPKSF